MGHQYELFKPVVVPCACCGRNAEFTFKAVSDQVVCEACVRHIGDTPSLQMRREREHILWWQQCETYWHAEHAEEVGRLTATHAAEVNRLEDEATDAKTLVAGLKATVQEEFKLHNPVVATWLDEQAIAEERARTVRARNYIGHLHRVLWHVDTEHHIPEESVEDVCRCGVLAADCPTYQALGPIRDRLYKWEQDQVERVRKRWPHELPSDHPEVKKMEPPRFGSTA